MVPSEIICRIFRIKVGNCVGTAFTLENNSIQYIVTAKHLFENEGYPSEFNIEILRNGCYETLHSMIYYHDNNQVDAVVLLTKPFVPISPTYSNENTTAGMIIGQDVYFLGFPYNYDSLMINFPNGKTPVPFIKKACLSGFSLDNDMFLDGINNPGFSGGPVCFKEYNTNKFKIAGIINSYRFNKSNLFDAKEKKTDYYIQENTGIINVCNIKKVYEIIDKIQ